MVQVRIEIDGKLSIDRSYEAFVIQRRIPEHPAESDGRHHKKGDIIAGRWADDCYPHTIERAMQIILQDAVMLSPETITDLRAAIREFKRVERVILGVCDKLGAALGDEPTAA